MSDSFDADMRRYDADVKSNLCTQTAERLVNIPPDWSHDYRDRYRIKSFNLQMVDACALSKVSSCYHLLYYHDDESVLVRIAYPHTSPPDVHKEFQSQFPFFPYSARDLLLRHEQMILLHEQRFSELETRLAAMINGVDPRAIMSGPNTSI